MSPTFHVPPNFSILPPPEGHLHLGTVLRDFEEREQMDPLNQDQRVEIDRVLTGAPQKNFRATRHELERGKKGIWGKFLALEAFGGQLSGSTDLNSNDVFQVDEIETQYFKASRKYITECLKLPDVEEYLTEWGNKKPVYLITGLKIAKGAKITLEKKIGTASGAGAGVNAALDLVDVQAGADVANQANIERHDTFTSSGFIIGVECVKIARRNRLLKGLFGGPTLQQNYVPSEAGFLGEGENSNETSVEFDLPDPSDDHGDPRVETRIEGDEIWVVRKE